MPVYSYSVIQLVPSPTRDERLNVGVLVAGDDPPYFKARFLGKREEQRLKRISFAEDIDFIDALKGEMERSEIAIKAPRLAEEPAWTVEAVRRAAGEWGGTLRISEPRSATHEQPDALLDALFTDFVADPRPPAPERARDRRWVRKKVREGLRQSLQTARPELEFEEVVARDEKVRGEFEEHQFDYRLGNGQLVQLVQALSVETRDRRAARTEVDAIAWAVDDVRRSENDVPISVVSIGDGAVLSTAERVYKGLGAELVREGEINPWIEQVSARLIQTLGAQAR
jgi:hypothetical protein